MSNGASVWQHTFALPWLNVSYPAQNGSTCSRGETNRFCDLVDDARLRLEDHHGEVYLKVLSDLETIKNMIPVSVKMSNKKKRDAWFPWVGRIASSLFGLVDEKDSKEMLAHIENMENMVDLSSKEITRIETALSSFVNTTNDRVGNAMMAVKNNHNLIIDLENKVSMWGHHFKTNCFILFFFYNECQDICRTWI